LVAVEDEAVCHHPPRLMDAACPREAPRDPVATLTLHRPAGWRRGCGDTRIGTREDRAEPGGRQIAKDDRYTRSDRIVPTSRAVIRGDLFDEVVVGERIDIF